MTRKQTMQIIVLLVLAVGYGIYTYVQHRQAVQPSSAATVSSQPSGTVLGVQTKASGCQVRGPLPDPACTPGATIPSATPAQICRSGYASSVRNVPSTIKAKVYREYGIASHPSGSYEVDHLVSLELGGSNDIANLWPEAAEPTPGFHEKDAVENYLHDQVCSGKLPLATAQKQIAGNWLDVYNSLH